MKLLMAFLLLIATAFAAPPVAKITGPSTARPGAIVILSIEGKAKHAKWKVDASAVDVPKDGAAEALEATAAVLREAGYTVELPAGDEPPVYMVLDSDQKRLLLSSYMGTYSVSLVVGDDEGVDLTTHRVVVSGTLPIPVPVPVPIPIPTPTPTPTPTPVPVPTDFSARLTSAVKAKPHVEYAKVADVYVLVADQIKSGLLSTPQQVTGFTSVMVPVAAGAHVADWQAIDASIIKPHLTTLTLAKASDYEPVWRQIATAVKAGLVDIPPPDPQPEPVPDPAPLPVSSLHVLIVEDIDQRHTLPSSQVDIFSSTTLRKWFTDNDVQWRIFPHKVDQSMLEQKWKDGMKKVADSGLKLPVVLVSNSEKGTIAVLPKTDAELIILLENYK